MVTDLSELRAGPAALKETRTFDHEPIRFGIFFIRVHPCLPAKGMVHQWFNYSVDAAPKGREVERALNSASPTFGGLRQ